MLIAPDPSLPTAPKGSASPYALFVKSWFPENKSKHVNSEGKIDLPTVATAMSTAWGALTMDDKQSYYDKAKELKKAFDAEYKTWYNGLDAATLKAIEKETGKKVSPPGGKRAKKLADKERPGNPGVPLTAFFEYMKAFRAAEGKDLSVSESGKQGGQNWREMSEDAKQVSVTVVSAAMASEESICGRAGGLACNHKEARRVANACIHNALGRGPSIEGEC